MKLQEACSFLGTILGAVLCVTVYFWPECPLWLCGFLLGVQVWALVCNVWLGVEEIRAQRAEGRAS